MVWMLSFKFSFLWCATLLRMTRQLDGVEVRKGREEQKKSTERKKDRQTEINEGERATSQSTVTESWASAV